jgi:hypothetical protein
MQSRQTQGLEAPAEQVPLEATNRVPFNPGDHLSVSRKFAGWLPYTHHAIYIGGSEVVQFGGEVKDKPGARVGYASFDRFEKGAQARLVPHGRREGIHWLPKADPPEKIVERARFLADRSLSLPSQPYNLIGHNCEHIANWCVCGYTESHQFKRHLYVVGLAKYALFLYVSWRIRNGAAPKGLLVGVLLLSVPTTWAIHVYNREIKRFWEGIRRDWPGE